MKKQKYLVSLVRNYGVYVYAENKQTAMEAAETFVSSGKDESNSLYREKYNFLIDEVEMADNTAVDATLVEDDG